MYLLHSPCCASPGLGFLCSDRRTPETKDANSALTSLIAMANPMPSTALPCATSITDVFTPITRAQESIKGPPLLPGLMAASVCSLPGRFAEMIPRVTVGDPARISLNGYPIAKTSSPTKTESEPPVGNGTISTLPVNRMQARSNSQSVPTTSPAVTYPLTNSRVTLA